jgi:ATP-dependent protease ClpP protease subunit
MSRARTSFNRAVPASVGRATRPAVPGPDGAESWYRIKNSLDEGGSPVASMYIYSDIGSWGITAASFIEELKAIDAPEIRLYVSSAGGDVFDGLAVHNALRSHRARVIVQVDSLAASIASVIAMAGDRIIMSPHSQMMVHMAAGAVAGEATELREYADFLDRQSENIAAVYQERAGGTVKHWLKLMAAETWFFADEAVAAGLADEVAKPMRRSDEDEDMPCDDRALAASWDLSVYNYAGREQAPAPDLATVNAATPPHLADGGSGEEDQAGAEPKAAAFDPVVFRAATVAALDPMPDYQPEHMRSLMAGVAGDAPAAPAPVRVEAAYVPPPVDTAPAAEPRQVAVDYWHSLFTAAANDAPAAPATPPAAPAVPVPQVVYVPEPPPPAGQVVAEYLRAVMTGVANDAPVPDQPAAPDPGAPEPVPAIDRTAFGRALWEASL